MAGAWWPWLAVAGAGALHGLNPACGWALAACSHRPHRALAPIALGHAAAVVGMAALVSLGLPPGGGLLAGLCGVLLAAALLWRHRGAGLALWSGLVASLHGSALMLVPAVVPLCLGAAPAREITARGSLLLSLGAVAVHLVAMLAVTAVLAAASRRALRRAGPKALAALGRRWISILGHHELDPRPRTDARR